MTRVQPEANFHFRVPRLF